MTVYLSICVFHTYILSQINILLLLFLRMFYDCYCLMYFIINLYTFIWMKCTLLNFTFCILSYAFNLLYHLCIIVNLRPLRPSLITISIRSILFYFNSQSRHTIRFTHTSSGTHFILVK